MIVLLEIQIFIFLRTTACNTRLVWKKH